MPSLTALLKEEISKIARKEVKDQIRELKKTVREQSSALARLEKKIGSAKAKATAKTPAEPTAKPAAAKVGRPPKGAKEKQIRIAPDTIKKHRKRLKLSQAELGKLLNVSTNTVLRWEAGSSKPQSKYLPGLDRLRTMSIRGKTPVAETPAEPVEPTAETPTEPVAETPAEPTAETPVAETPAEPTAKVGKTSKGAKEKQIRIAPDTIKKHRKRLKLSQAELGKLLNVSTNTVLRWEAGSSKPQGKHLPGLSKLRTMSMREIKQQRGE